MKEWKKWKRERKKEFNRENRVEYFGERLVIKNIGFLRRFGLDIGNEVGREGVKGLK